MEIKVFQDLGQGVCCIDANYVEPGIACFYLLEEAGECAILDTGTQHSLANLEAAMAAMGIEGEQIRYIIPTHVHLDHAGGAGAMMARFPQAQLVVHPKGARHLQNPERLVASSTAVYGESLFAKLYGEVLPIAKERMILAEDGYRLSVGGRELLFRHTAGHADHHFCIWDQRSRGWFSGDMFGISYSWQRFGRGNYAGKEGGDFVIPSTTPTQFRPQSYLDSIALIASYHPDNIYLTHYGLLPFSHDLATMLISQLQRYQELAQACGDDLEALIESVLDYSVQCMAELVGETEALTHRDKLAMDAKLNAQGLMVWQQRLQAA